MQIIQTEKGDLLDKKIIELVEYYFNSKGLVYFQIQVEMKAKALKQLLVSFDANEFSQFVYPRINHCYLDESDQVDIRVEKPLFFRENYFQSFEQELVQNYSAFDLLIDQGIQQHHQDKILPPNQIKIPSLIQKEIYQQQTPKIERQLIKQNSEESQSVCKLKEQFTLKTSQTEQSILTQSEIQKSNLKYQQQLNLPDFQKLITNNAIKQAKKSIKKRQKQRLFHPSRPQQKQKRLGVRQIVIEMQMQLSKLMQLECQQGIPINHDDILKKAESIIKGINYKTSFRANKSWLQRYLHMHPELAKKIKTSNKLSKFNQLSIQENSKQFSQSVEKIIEQQNEKNQKQPQ